MDDVHPTAVARRDRNLVLDVPRQPPQHGVGRPGRFQYLRLAHARPRRADQEMLRRLEPIRKLHTWKHSGTHWGLVTMSLPLRVSNDCSHCTAGCGRDCSYIGYMIAKVAPTSDGRTPQCISRPP